jgi:hypothetical protein
VVCPKADVPVEAGCPKADVAAGAPKAEVEAEATGCPKADVGAAVVDEEAAWFKRLNRICSLCWIAASILFNT